MVSIREISGIELNEIEKMENDYDIDKLKM